MPEKNIVEEAIGDLVDNFTEAVQKNKRDTVASRFNRLFGREKPIHHVLGGGRSADVLLWRNKKISASFLMGATAIWAVFGLWVAAIIGSCCNFLTVLYIGFVGAHTMPLLYERYEDEVDGFVDSLLMKFHSHYKKIDSGFLSRIPSGKFGFKKHD
ncbi:hypothetical protein DY000_02051013 [Brassica cretica]|uniref:Reticulon-like protein n=1 Tax=Brassica cretica TaxID=69181 RepID=A0ABQ7ET94_BRACR|nr:hypothetical protein DY000_02051013 [Brassica cretica]